MASTALPHTTHSQENLQRQFMAASSPPDEPASSSHNAGHQSAPSPPPTVASTGVDHPVVGGSYPSFDRSNSQQDPYNYAEASVTSGSNSGEEDDRSDLSGNNKRLGGHLNGFSSKKRRKQSKPIRLGSQGGDQDEMPTQSGQDHGRDEEEEGLVNSTTPELEDGERRPSLAGLPTDLPLNLSAAAAAAASHPTLRVLGAELLQNPDKIPTSIASLYQGGLQGGMLGPFGLPPFPFPFPTSSRPPISTAGSTPPVTAGGRIQIFNPEAYCELCNKEFCNKYFLKTHKANKHGIYSEGVPLSGSPPTSSSPSNNGAHQQGPEEGRPLPPTSQSSQGPPTPNSQAGSPFSGAFIAANMGALRPPFVPLSPGASPSPKGNSDMMQPPRDNAPSRESANADLRSQIGAPGGGLPGSLMSPRSGDNSIPDFRQTMEERERLMQRDASGLLPKENGELRKSLESP